MHLGSRGPVTGLVAPCATLFSLALTVCAFTTNSASGQGFFERSLKSIPVPEPLSLNDYIADREAAIRLGKALFWDVRVGTDGKTACATCHHQAGSDSRVSNIANPGADGAFSAGFAPGTPAPASHFPMTAFNNPANRASGRTRSVDDIAGSAGILRSTFVGNGTNADFVTLDPEPIFNSAAGPERQVTGRNTPSVVNAAFNIRQFWDGRANAWFNGVNPFGSVDSTARVWQVNAKTGAPSQTQLAIDHASLASQAVGPANNSVEMAAHGRNWTDLARKLLDSRALATQRVSANDSQLGALASSDGGLTTTYRTLIEQAFQPRWVSNAATPDGFSVTEANMSFYFGLAVQAYETTLISDDSRYDQWIDQDGPNGFAPGLLSNQELRGLRLFFNVDPLLPPTNCRECHVGPAFSVATYVGKGTKLVGNLGMGVFPGAMDSDGDGYPDLIDPFPLNPAEWLDTDRDGIGNNLDLDDDNDGIPDLTDAFPLDEDNGLGEPAPGVGVFAPVPIALMEDLAGGLAMAMTFEEPPMGFEPTAIPLDFPLLGGGIDLYDPNGVLLTHVPLPARSAMPCSFLFEAVKPLTKLAPMAKFIVEAQVINCRLALVIGIHGFPLGDYTVTIDGVQRGVLQSKPFRIYDEGFYNIGVRPMGEDPGVHGSHPNGVPLSGTMRLLGGNTMAEFMPVTTPSGHLPAVKNSFKTPSLRNVELTGPYFHNGGVATLEDVIRLYNRGGDFHDDNVETLAPSILALGLNESHITDLAAFLRTLTDERVRNERAPFDHPSLELSDGRTVPAIGADGRAAACATRLHTFAENLYITDPFYGDCDHNGLLDACEITRAPELDANQDGVLDACVLPCIADITDDRAVDGSDLAQVLASWNRGGKKAGRADIDGSGLVDGGDLAILLGSWGPCR